MIIGVIYIHKSFSLIIFLDFIGFGSAIYKTTVCRVFFKSEFALSESTLYFYITLHIYIYAREKFAFFLFLLLELKGLCIY